MNKKKILIPGALVVLVFAGVFGWLSTGQYVYAGNTPFVAPANLQYSDISSPDGCLIEPAESADGTVGFVLYPGGKVAPEAYLPVAAAMAEMGISVFIVKTPFNLAFFAPGSGYRARSYRPDIERWYIGGHSLGGIVAASVAASNPDAWAGLVLFASYTTKRSDLSDTDLPVLSVYGAVDHLVPPSATHANARYLPVNTMYVNIPGANHAGFGFYGPQKRDGIADITPEEQRSKIASAVRIFLERNGSR